jgi:hypothetical protein
MDLQMEFGLIRILPDDIDQKHKMLNLGPDSLWK